MWFIIFFIALLIFYFTGIKPTRYWKDRGIPNLKPWPYVGNLAEVAFRKRSILYVANDTYSAFPERRYCGFYNFGNPTLMLRDPELIKRILVKEFETFPDHRPLLPEDTDPLWNKNLLAMRGGERWQDMRSTLSPSFTSSKMRMMFEFMKECSKQYSDHFLKENKMVIVELKDTFTRFATDVIATTAFGITCNSLEKKDNKFYLMAKEMTDFSGIHALIILINMISPTLAKMLNLPIISPGVGDFFRGVIKETIQLREERNIVRLDMLHLLLEARKGRLKPEDQDNEVIDTGFATVQESEVGKAKKRQKAEITDEDITAQALVFFFAGFETLSTMLCYACYELALHPDIQETLRGEVDEVLEEQQGNFTYESLMKIKYLDMVVTETLRKWPPVLIVGRRSVRPFTIEPEKPEEKPLHLPKGSQFEIPVYSIHRDPQYYADPDKFDPERFNDQNKGSIRPFTYLPFGAGPRNCIGSRFALLEGKLILAEIISKFVIVPVEKTQIPIQISKTKFMPIPDEGIWLGLRPRK